MPRKKEFGLLSRHWEVSEESKRIKVATTNTAQKKSEALTALFEKLWTWQQVPPQGLTFSHGPVNSRTTH